MVHDSFIVSLTYIIPKATSRLAVHWTRVVGQLEVYKCKITRKERRWTSDFYWFESWNHQQPG